MKNIKVLDCTLRDGGRIINCEFEDRITRAISKELTKANIDIVEVGFLRGHDLVDYKGNSTFFTETSQIAKVLPSNRRNTMFTAFIDYNMYDFSKLELCDGTSIDAIRVGFTKKQFNQNLEDIKKCLLHVKKQGYKLFVQGVNSLSYSDAEMLKLIKLMNEVQPYSFGIVDTYGAMYLDDIVHYFDIVNYNLDESICIDVHSHNNFQSSFAFAQDIIGKCADGKRTLIVDASLDGMGKGAGNLNTELIIDYLVRKKNYDYDFDRILDVIDDYITPYADKHKWGYNVPALMSGIYKAHPNNVIYLTSKYRLMTKDIKNILSMIDPDTRQRYNYDNIERLYVEYSSSKVDDNRAIDILGKQIQGKPVLVMAPGATVNEKRADIVSIIEKEHPFIISVNFVPSFLKNITIFWGNKKKYMSAKSDQKSCMNIICSNVNNDASDNEILVNYHSLIDRGNKYFDNSTMMLLNLLKRIGVKKIFIAGFDGFDKDKSENYVNGSFQNNRYISHFDEVNDCIESMMKKYAESVVGKCDIQFITPSKYESAVRGRKA